MPAYGRQLSADERGFVARLARNGYARPPADHLPLRRENAGRYHAAQGAVKIVHPLRCAVSPGLCLFAHRMQPARSSPTTDAVAEVDPIDPQRLRMCGRLATVEHLAETESTMHRGRVLAATVPREMLPAVVLADRQTAGRGRRGAGWWQAAGSLAMTLVVDPSWLSWPAAAERSPAAAGWSLACGIALAEAVMDAEPGVPAGLRWPNDLEVKGRKLAGILAEGTPSGRVLFGIGVNTSGRVADAPRPLADRVVTMPDLVGRILPRQRLLEGFLPRLWDVLTRLAIEPNLLRQRYAPLCTLTGTEIEFHHGNERVQGLCLGINADGALLIRTATGDRSFHGGSLTPQSSQWQPEDSSPS